MTDAERQHLRQLQKQRRDAEGYVTATVVLMRAGVLGKWGRPWA